MMMTVTDDNNGNDNTTDAFLAAVRFRVKLGDVLTESVHPTKSHLTEHTIHATAHSTGCTIHVLHTQQHTIQGVQCTRYIHTTAKNYTVSNTHAANTQQHTLQGVQYTRYIHTTAHITGCPIQIPYTHNTNLSKTYHNQHHTLI